jgi:hypothetical protein
MRITRLVWHFWVRQQIELSYGIFLLCFVLLMSKKMEVLPARMPRDRLTKLKNGWRRPLDYDLCAEIQHHLLLLAVRNEDNAFFSGQLFSPEYNIAAVRSLQTAYIRLIKI